MLFRSAHQRPLFLKTLSLSATSSTDDPCILRLYIQRRLFHIVARVGCRQHWAGPSPDADARRAPTIKICERRSAQPKCPRWERLEGEPHGGPGHGRLIAFCPFPFSPLSAVVLSPSLVSYCHQPTTKSRHVLYPPIAVRSSPTLLSPPPPAVRHPTQTSAARCCECTRPPSPPHPHAPT